MDLLKFFIKDEVPAVGLTCFRDKKEEMKFTPPKHYNYNRQIFSADYSKNFFLL